MVTNRKIKDFRDLEVYQLANKLTLDIYGLVGTKIQQTERFGITDQLKRASISIGANIAEGFGRYHTKEYIKFLYIARGSLMEVWHFLILSKDLEYLGDISNLEQSINILAVKLNNLISAISNKK